MVSAVTQPSGAPSVCCKRNMDRNVGYIIAIVIAVCVVVFLSLAAIIGIVIYHIKKKKFFKNPKETLDLIKGHLDSHDIDAATKLLSSTLKDKQVEYGYASGTLLNYASYSCGSLTDVNIEPFVKKLIELGANPNAKDSEGRTPLHLACTKEVAEVFVKYGADLESVDNEGKTPLAFALFSTFIQESKALFLLDQNVNLFAKDKEGNTTLHLACRGHSDRKVVEHLLGKGLDIETKNVSGETPLIHAILSSGVMSSEKAQRKISLLIEKGANTHVRPTGGHYKEKTVVDIGRKVYRNKKWAQFIEKTFVGVARTDYDVIVYSDDDDDGGGGGVTYKKHTYSSSSTSAQSKAPQKKDKKNKCECDKGMLSKCYSCKAVHCSSSGKCKAGRAKRNGVRCGVCGKHDGFSTYYRN